MSPAPFKNRVSVRKCALVLLLFMFLVFVGFIFNRDEHHGSVPVNGELGIDRGAAGHVSVGQQTHVAPPIENTLRTTSKECEVRPEPTTVPNRQSPASPKSHIFLGNVKVAQRVKDSKTKFYIHRAFLDDRYNETYVRIFGLESKDLDTGKWQCRWQFKHGGVPDHVVPARKFHTFSKWPRSTVFYAFNFDCHFAVQLGLPGKVTEIQLESSKGYRFVLKVEETIRYQEKRDLAVCTKPLTGKLDAVRFVEWIELQRIAGIEHFIIYLADVSGQVNSVLEYYQEQGLVTVVSFPFYLAVIRQVEPPVITSKQRYGVAQQLYLVGMQDCLYRFRGAYNFLQFLDTDEVMLPSEPLKKWPQVVQQLAKKYYKAAGFLFHTAWHFEELGAVNETTSPSHLYTMRYARATVPTMNQPKSVIVTSRAVSVNYHSVLDVMARRFGNQPVSWEKYGYVHFRGTCSGKLTPDECKKMMSGTTRLDPVIVKYRTSLDEQVTQVRDFLQLT